MAIAFSYGNRLSLVPTRSTLVAVRSIATAPAPVSVRVVTSLPRPAVAPTALPTLPIARPTFFQPEIARPVDGTTSPPVVVAAPTPTPTPTPERSSCGGCTVTETPAASATPLPAASVTPAVEAQQQTPAVTPTAETPAPRSGRAVWLALAFLFIIGTGLAVAAAARPVSRK